MVHLAPACHSILRLTKGDPYSIMSKKMMKQILMLLQEALASLSIVMIFVRSRDSIARSLTHNLSVLLEINVNILTLSQKSCTIRLFLRLNPAEI